jgi:hypothetical protein
MDIPEFRRHVADKELLKIVSHLHECKALFFKATERIKLIGRNNEATQAIECNIDALIEGILETIRMAAHARAQFMDEMVEPDNNPFLAKGSLRIYATPFQRALMREGVVFPPNMPKFIPNKRQTRAPKIIPFHLSTKRHNRRKGKDYVPL